MNIIITAPIAVLFLVAVVDFAGRMVVLWNRQQPTPVADIPTDELSPLEITLVIEPIALGGGMELPAAEIPTKIRDLKKFVRTYSLQQAIREYTQKPYSHLKRAELIDAIQMAIA